MTAHLRTRLPGPPHTCYQGKAPGCTAEAGRLRPTTWANALRRHITKMRPFESRDRHRPRSHTLHAARPPRRGAWHARLALPEKAPDPRQRASFLCPSPATSLAAGRGPPWRQEEVGLEREV